MANCIKHKEVGHGGWCVICLLEALRQIQNCTRLKEAKLIANRELGEEGS